MNIILDKTRRLLINYLLALISLSIFNIGVLHAQTDTEIVIMPQRYYSDYVTADSIYVCFGVSLPQDGKIPLGINYFYAQKYQNGKRLPLEFYDLSRNNAYLLGEDIFIRFIPSSYSSFIQYAIDKGLPKQSYKVITKIYPKRPISDLNSEDIQDLLHISNNLNSKRFLRRWHLKCQPPKRIKDLRDYAFKRLPMNMLNNTDTLVVIELPIEGAEYFWNQIYITGSKNGEVFEFMEEHPGKIVSVIPSQLEKEVKDLVKDFFNGDVILSNVVNGGKDPVNYYSILLLVRKKGHFTPILYVNTNIYSNGVPKDIIDALEDALDNYLGNSD